MLRSLFLPRERLARGWLKQTGFSGGPLTHELLVPAGPGGQPGERLRSPSRSLYAPRIASDGSREDFRVVVDDHGSTLAAVCLRRIERPETVEELAWSSLRRMLDYGFDGTFEITPAQLAGETAYGYCLIRGRNVLTDWKLARAGWLYVVGTLSWAPPGKHEDTMERSLDALGTWEWL